MNVEKFTLRCKVTTKMAKNRNISAEFSPLNYN